MLYGALFLVAGTALLAITYGLVANGTAAGGQAVLPLRHQGAGGRAARGSRHRRGRAEQGWGR